MTVDAATEARVRASSAAQTMLATLGATMVEVGPGGVGLEMPSDRATG